MNNVREAHVHGQGDGVRVRALLRNTLYSKVYEGQACFERGESPRVADIGAAVRRVLQND
ncbi:MAG: hypothetical protein Q8P31_02390 [Bacillota bacterium]|nr:hypothetical protein [Bacillota bacterium]